MTKFTKQALAIVAIAAFAVAGCKKGNEGSFDRSTGAGGPFTGADSVITGNISASRTLSPGKVYKIDGIAYVTGGAKLTIKPGTVITTGAAVNYKTAPGAASKAIAGVLVITKDGTIDAVGTASNPIVFTSPKAAGSRVAGDFGGVIILGESTTNRGVTTTQIEGLPTYDANGVSLGVDITYGGSVPADNSGRFQYVRIEYAGFKLDTDIEINGLTMGGVGSETKIHHVQVSFGADDAFEFFGGTVSPTYLIALANDDDDFDTDFGYGGSIQYAIGLKDPSSTHSTSGGVSDSNGIESDNDATGSTASTRTKPVYSNFTLLGYGSSASSLRAGNRWRRNTDLSITNSIIAGYNAGAQFESTGTIASAVNFTDNILHAFVTPSTTTLPSSNTLLMNDNPASVIGLGLSSSNAPLNPFYTTALASSYTIDNLFPRDASSTKGAVTDANYSQWQGAWVNFTPQTSQD